MTLGEKVKEPEMRLYIDKSAEAERLVKELRDKGYSVHRIFTGASEPTVLYDHRMVGGWCRIRRSFPPVNYLGE